MLILEMTADYKKRGMTLIDALDALFETYGHFGEGMTDIYMEGLDGIEKRRRVMSSLRENPPREIGGVRVVSGYVVHMRKVPIQFSRYRTYISSH